MTTQAINRRIVLAARPKGAPTTANFRLEEQPVPTPKDGEMLLRTIWLSLDPYMRGRMNDGPSYAAPVEVGAVMGAGTVCRVEESKHPQFSKGDLVVSKSECVRPLAALSGAVRHRSCLACRRPSC